MEEEGGTDQTYGVIVRQGSPSGCGWLETPGGVAARKGGKIILQNLKKNSRPPRK